MKNKIRIKKVTAESITEGHPDKICDLISDNILDAYLEKDKLSHVACEVAITKNFVLVMGEITSTAKINIEQIVRDTIRNIGYNDKEDNFDADTVEVCVKINKQSLDIARGVEDDNGAGDQGIMFGYACNETIEYMPAPIMYAHKLTKRLTECRINGDVDCFKPDGKSQVTVEYHNDVIARIDNVVISIQHDKNADIKKVRKNVIEKVIKKVLPKELIDENTKYYINPTGRFVIGGPNGDSGLTGRKIIVDTYGGVGHHGGGAFSGKDPSKVDRSASYMARYIAKNLVAAGIADRIEVGLSYAIGVSEPTSILVDSFNTSKINESKIIELIKSEFKLTPKEIISQLDLRNPIYKLTTNYGHFGKENLPWEKLDKVKELKKYLL